MSLDRDIGYLRQVPLMAEFSEEQLRLLAFSAENITIEAGKELYRQGANSDAGFVIVSGRFALVEDAAEGASDEVEPVERAVVGPGTLLGEMALFIETRRPNTAVARERSDVIRIRRALFRRMLQEYPAIAARLQAFMAGRLKATTADMTRIADTLDTISAFADSGLGRKPAG